MDGNAINYLWTATAQGEDKCNYNTEDLTPLCPAAILISV